MDNFFTKTLTGVTLSSRTTALLSAQKTDAIEEAAQAVRDDLEKLLTEYEKYKPLKLIPFQPSFSHADAMISREPVGQLDEGNILSILILTCHCRELKPSTENCKLNFLSTMTDVQI